MVSRTGYRLSPHDLEALAKLCLPSLAALAALLDDLRFLTSFAVEIRYPGTFASRQDAESCWQSAARARVLLRKHLGLESAPETGVETGDHSDACPSSDAT